jgi:hypothetical protein
MNRHPPSHPSSSQQPSSHKASKKQADVSPPTGSNAGSGRPTFDARGNASWEWQTDEEGKFSAEVDTQHLRKLEAELSLEDTARVKALDLDQLRSGVKHDFNPYDRGVLTNRGSAVGASEIKTKQIKAKESEPRKPIKDLRKYDEWLKMKKRLASQKDD